MVNHKNYHLVAIEDFYFYFLFLTFKLIKCFIDNLILGMKS